MKYAAILMVLLLVVSLGAVGYLYMTANVTIEGLGVTATEAAAQPDYFADLAAQMDTGALVGTPFVSTALGSPEEYQFLTFTVRLRNNCFVPADMIEVQVTPMDGDVLQVGDTTVKLLPARSTGDVTATILTAAGMHSVREITVTYYIWGMPFSVKATSYNRQ